MEMLYYVSSDRHSLDSLEDAKSQCLSISEEENNSFEVLRETDCRVMFISYYDEDKGCWALRKPGRRFF
jgi:hypothetical protein